jgi:hypothetical protein
MERSFPKTIETVTKIIADAETERICEKKFRM